MSSVVIRRRNDKMVGMRVDAHSSLHLKKNSFFFYLKPNDVIFVPKTTISKIGDVAEDIQRMLMFNGWGFSIEVTPFGEQLPVSTTLSGQSTSVSHGIDEDGDPISTTTTTTDSQTRETEYEKK